VAVQVNPANGDLHFGAGAARVSVPGMSQARAIKLETDILGANNRVAQQNREHFLAHGVTALNLVSSPGSGKTTLLCATIEALRARSPALHVAVIEGDQQTSFDADRIRATGAPAIQVNTGAGCHLDAPMVAAAFDRLPLHHAPAEAGGLLFIENVGNLVCPAMWDLGEAAKVAILSVTEGEDKPLKYPDMFAASQLMILNKIDLLGREELLAIAAGLNERARFVATFMISALTGSGVKDILADLARRLGRRRRLLSRRRLGAGLHQLHIDRAVHAHPAEGADRPRPLHHVARTLHPVGAGAVAAVTVQSDGQALRLLLHAQHPLLLFSPSGGGEAGGNEGGQGQAGGGHGGS
jgi:hydrogenase nickel incorporation protein HypB